MTDNPDLDGGDNAAKVAVSELRDLVKRRMKLEGEKAEAADAIKDLNTFVKSKGFDMKAFNEIIKLEKMEPEERKNREDMRSFYIDALDIFG